MPVARFSLVTLGCLTHPRSNWWSNRLFCNSLPPFFLWLRNDFKGSTSTHKRSFMHFSTIFCQNVNYLLREEVFSDFCNNVFQLKIIWSLDGFEVIRQAAFPWNLWHSLSECDGMHGRKKEKEERRAFYLFSACSLHWKHFGLFPIIKEKNNFVCLLTFQDRLTVCLTVFFSNRLSALVFSDSFFRQTVFFCTFSDAISW